MTRQNRTTGEPYRVMEYRGIPCHIVQAIDGGWRCSVTSENKRKSGTALRREVATTQAHRYIDRRIKKRDRSDSLPRFSKSTNFAVFAATAVLVAHLILPLKGVVLRVAFVERWQDSPEASGCTST
jgi:hypothetical protein